MDKIRLTCSDWKEKDPKFTGFEHHNWCRILSINRPWPKSGRGLTPQPLFFFARSLLGWVFSFLHLAGFWSLSNLWWSPLFGISKHIIWHIFCQAKPRLEIWQPWYSEGEGGEGAFKQTIIRSNNFCLAGGGKDTLFSDVSGKFTPLKINGWNLNITQFFKRKWTKPPWLFSQPSRSSSRVYTPWN